MIGQLQSYKRNKWSNINKPGTVKSVCAYKLWPPSILTESPVIFAAAGDNRKQTNADTCNEKTIHFRMFQHKTDLESISPEQMLSSCRQPIW